MISSSYDFQVHLRLVLATGPGNPPAVRVLARGSVRFVSRRGQKPDLPCLGGVVNRTGHKPAVFGRVGTGPQFHITVPTTLTVFWLELSI
jgi:hypothetical protein